MHKIINDFEDYVRGALAIRANSVVWEGAERLPVYLRNLYWFYRVALLDVHFLLIVPRDQEERTPATIRKHISQLQEKWDGEVVFVDRAVSSHNRKRLIEHKVPFVIPGNQMYLPMLGIDLREHFRKLRQTRSAFSPSTQVLVLHAIYRGNGQILTPSDASWQLGYSAMTMSRAFDELESVGIGEHSATGKERYCRFNVSGKDLWEQALQYMRTPARKRLNVLIEKPPKAVKAGLSALAHYSMLAEPKNPVFAFAVDEWKALCRGNSITELTVPEPGSLEIELWSYSPGQFAVDGFVDRLSLYLSLKETNDERTEAALEEMMESIQW